MRRYGLILSPTGNCEKPPKNDKNRREFQAGCISIRMRKIELTLNKRAQIPLFSGSLTET